jgi:hypothetical protein
MHALPSPFDAGGASFSSVKIVLAQAIAFVLRDEKRRRLIRRR